MSFADGIPEFANYYHIIYSILHHYTIQLLYSNIHHITRTFCVHFCVSLC